MLYAVPFAELGELCSELRATVCSNCCRPSDFNEPIGQLSDDGCRICTSQLMCPGVPRVPVDKYDPLFAYGIEQVRPDLIHGVYC